MYKRLILKNYDRLSVTGIDYIEINFNEDVLLVLGDNGSGKSSLLSEITLWPTEKTDYLDDGYKYIELHNPQGQWASEMTMVGKKASYQLYKDGVALNETGSITRQKELVMMHFGMDQSIKDLIMGHEKFTLMSPARKKDWFLKMRSMDYEWVMKLHKKMMEDLRDISGAIRVGHKQLMIESAKLVEKSQLIKYQREVELIEGVLEEMMGQWRGLSSMSVGESRTLEIEQMIKVYDQKISLMTIPKSSQDELLENIKAAEISVASHQALMKQLSQNIHDIRDDIAKLNSLHLSDISDIDKRVDELNDSRQKLMALGAVYKPDIEKIKDAWLIHKPQVMQVLYDVPKLEASYFSIDELQILMGRRVVLEKDAYDWDVQFQSLKSQAEHMNRHKDVIDITCPNCQHGFNTIYNAAKYTELVNQSNVAYEKFIEIKKSIKDISDRIDVRANAIASMQTFVRLKNQLGILSDFWEIISRDKVITSGQSISSVCDAFDLHLDRCVELIKIEKNLLDLTSVKTVNLYEQKTSVASLEAKLISLENQYVEHLNCVSKDTNTITQAKKDIECIKVITGYNQKLRLLYAEHVKHVRARVQYDCQVQYNKMISEITEYRNDMMKTIRLAQAQEGIVELLSRELKELEDKKENLEILIKQLSPNEGIIAKSISNFMSQFVTQINDCIAKMWTYDLEVLECVKDSESFELDYKFGFCAADVRPRSDVIKGSTAIKDVIDFAFRFVTQIYLNLCNEPLFLDEFAAHFDPKHRIKAGEFIRQCIDENIFSQVLMISHYREMYDGFSNVQVCALAQNNIELPDQFTAVNDGIVINR